MLTDRLGAALEAVRHVIDSFEATQLTGEEAAGLVDSFAELERLANAGRTLAGRRAEQAGIWEKMGYRTPAQWMAVRAQSTLGAAIATLETGRRLEELPATREALRLGTLSAQQAQEIASAAAMDPASESALL
ncbi:MAG: hypothetical protein ACRDKS_08465, partial [Actinomycetota bacterium]